MSLPLFGRYEVESGHRAKHPWARLELWVVRRIAISPHPACETLPSPAQLKSLCVEANLVASDFQRTAVDDL